MSVGVSEDLREILHKTHTPKHNVVKPEIIDDNLVDKIHISDNVSQLSCIFSPL